MQIGSDDFFHLTYCTNIHPGNGWNEVFANLQRYVLPLQARLAPGEKFGIGLRLSDIDSRELLQGEALQRFQNFLRDHNLYVFTLNGFPYGPFHGQPVKAQVHAPDWRAEERVAYTLRLLQILTTLLPDGMDGSISTSPLSYKTWVDTQDTAAWECFTDNIVRIAQALVQVKQEQGKLLHLDIEPEPDGLLENSEELLRFYTDWLLERGARLLAKALHCDRDEARAHLLEHIRVCFDTCHVAVAYEEPATVLERFEQFGIKIGKVQISSALKVFFPNEEKARADLAATLAPFAESTYLHQVIQKHHDGTFLHYPDLIEALPHIQDQHIAQWRIHFHVPVFLERYGAFLSTQDTTKRSFDLLTQRRFCSHLEIETYTWSVLPEDLRKDLLDSITREYQWVLDNIHE